MPARVVNDLRGACAVCVSWPAVNLVCRSLQHALCQGLASGAQDACIFNATLRDNVLLGREYDPALFSQVVEACALGPDLAVLEAGDLTEIGEKGALASTRASHVYIPASRPISHAC